MPGLFPALVTLFSFPNHGLGHNLKFMAKILLLLVSGVLLGAAVAHADGPPPADSGDAQPFQFKFSLNKPLAYAVEIKVGEIKSNGVGQRASLTRTTTDTRYKIRLTPMGTNADGTMSVLYEPYDYEVDTHIIGPSGDFESNTRDLNVISKQNGIITVDTARDIGVSPNLKEAIYPNLLSGYMDFQPSGRIQKFEGDLPFIDFWQHRLQYNTNLFYIVFPAGALAVHDTWTNNYYIKSAGPVVLDNNGVVETYTFTREPDQNVANGPVAVFSLSMSSDNKDLTGHMDQMGQQNMIEMPEQVHSINGTFQFDQKQGCLVSLSESENGRVDMNMVIQGNSANGHTEEEQTISMTLIPPP